MSDDPLGEQNSKTIIGEGRFLRLVDDAGWEYAERARGSGVVAVVAITDDDCLVLTEQYRPAVKASVIDLPAGLAGDTDEFSGESEQIAAARELEEETGYRAESWTRLVTVPTSPGLSSEKVTIFLAEQLTRSRDGGGDESEAIDVHVIPLADLLQWLEQQIRAGRLIDPKVYAGLWLKDSKRVRREG